MTLALSGYATDWLDILFRWLHVIAGIAWIGSSFYFIALDNHLLAPKDERDAARGVGGESWEIHGGGFYHVQKYRVAPETLPEPLHWFKWEAYTTWLSGFALMIVLYYLHASTYLVDPSVSDISTGWAIAISVAALAGSWLVYDVLCRLLGEREGVLAACVAGLVVLAAWGLSHVFGGRALYLQIGAMLGTIMVANVFFVIIPAHRELVRAKEAGKEPDPRHNARGKQRSVHNNYLTLPVVFAMLSNHFPTAYSHSHAWLILVALMAIGAWVRHFFNLRHVGRNVWAIPVTAALALAGVAVWIRPGSAAAPASGKPVSFARAQAIVVRRCAPCHSEHPTEAGVSTAPKGVLLDTAARISAQADRIRQLAVDTKAMPLGNVTHMTDAERSELAAWLDSRK